MKALTAAASLFMLGSTLLSSRASEACTQPTEEAGNPTVGPGGPEGGSGMGDGEPAGSGVPGDEPGDESVGGPGGQPGDGTAGGPGDPTFGGDESIGGPRGDPVGSGFPTFTPDPAGEVGSTPSALVAVEWRPGADVDADPMGGAYFRHQGHKIETRIVILDRASQSVVLDERVPQYDYATATRDAPGQIHTRFATRLPPGEYVAKVQSVFSRHDEIRYGLDGRWESVDEAGAPPAIAASVRGVSFSVSPLVEDTLSGGFVGGGCSATGVSGGELAPVLALMVLGLVRRRRSA
ncbi:MAG: hypothetical protein HY791_07265 [Deltaproteobacteria bacterium]|nr:hypothetical protein [Deltaproteobacteria bacterium]